MPKSNTKVLAIEAITIPENRQRSGPILVDNTDGLQSSIERLGLLQPIVVTPEGELIAGERRLTAVKALGWEKMTVIVRDPESVVDRALVEYAENEQRSGLKWPDKVRALAHVHTMLTLQAKAEGAKWSTADTAEYAGFSSHKNVSKALKLTKALATRPDLDKESSIDRAYNMVLRVEEIIKDREEAQLRTKLVETGMTVLSQVLEDDLSEEELDAIREEGPEGVVRAAPQVSTAPPSDPARLEQFKIIEADCYKWAESYSGPLFDICHLDPPYGINIGGAGMALTQGMEGYQDTEDDYWKALEFWLKTWDGLAAYAHTIVWCDPRQIVPTMEWLNANGWEAVNRPIIWTKSDNAGTIPNPDTDPRWTYETGVVARRGGRRVSKNVAGHYSCPTSKAIHPTEKPIPMLKHFLRLVEQPGSNLIDPMCGSGNSLRAWAKFKEVSGIGIELNPDWATAGAAALRTDLRLEAASGPKFEVK